MESESAASQTDDIKNRTSPSTQGVMKATEMFKLDVFFFSLIILTDARDVLAEAQKMLRIVVLEGLRTRLQGVMGKLEK